MARLSKLRNLLNRNAIFVAPPLKGTSAIAPVEARIMVLIGSVAHFAKF
jgi:hypothetical protein